MPGTEVVVTDVLEPGVVEVVDPPATVVVVVDDAPGAVVVEAPGTVVVVVVVVEVDDVVVVLTEPSMTVVVVVGTGQKSADQLIVVVVVNNGLEVEVNGSVVDVPTDWLATLPTHTTMCEIDLSPSNPPPCPPGSETPFLFTSANTPNPGSGE